MDSSLEHNADEHTALLDPDPSKPINGSMISMDDGDGSEPRRPNGNNLGLLNGVVVPCLLNIVGAVLFLRLSWSVGQAGFFGVLLMFIVGTAQTTLTALSMSALISNGVMRGGGGYYIISRAVGPELGGAIGVCFYFCYSFGCGFYMVSTAESFVEAVFPGNNWPYYAIHVLTASVCLWTAIAVGLIGAHCFTKVNVPLFVIQFGSILYGCLSIFFSPDPCIAGTTPAPGYSCGELLCANATGTYACGSFNGWSGQNLLDNAWVGFTDVNCNGGTCSMLVVYSIVFTAVTGIFEGANLSGDLRDPNRHIWRGTLIAIYGAFFTYVFSIFAFAGGFDRYTLQHNMYVLQETAFGSSWIIIVGIWVACYTSGLGNLMGGSRILQAIARDRLFPGIAVFGRGFGPGDEPRLAILLTGAIGQCAILIGGVNTIAPIITTFFCLSYGLVNMALLLVALSGTPNFRPRFKYFHWSTALVGLLLNLAVMWALSWLYALLACAVFVALVLWLSFGYVPNSNIAWGDARVALMFHQIRKFLLKLQPSQQSGKLWRPSVLLFVRDQASPLLQVCNYLKRGGIYIVGDVLVAPRIDRDGNAGLLALQASWSATVADAKIKAFSHVLAAPSARLGYHSLVCTSGLGALSPNTVVLPWPWTQTACASADEYVLLMRDIVQLGKNLVVAHGFTAPAALIVDVVELFEPRQSRTLDIFLPPHVATDTWERFSAGALGILTIAWSLLRRRLGVQLYKLLDAGDSLTPEATRTARDQLVDVVKRQGRFRIGKKGAGIRVLPQDGGGGAFRGAYPSLAYWESVNATVRQHVARDATNVVFLPMVGIDEDAATVLAHVEALVRDLGPTLLIQQSQAGSELMSRVL